MNKIVLITGSKGFLGKNIVFALKKFNYQIKEFNENDTQLQLIKNLKKVNLIIHLAGVQRPVNQEMYYSINFGLTKKIVDELVNNKLSIPIIFASSTYVENYPDSLYSKSKLEAERYLEDYSKKTGDIVKIYRFNNVFGPGAKVNYSSVVANFIYYLINNKKIEISEPYKLINFVYIDDLVDSVVSLTRNLLDNTINNDNKILYIRPVYEITLINLLTKIYLISTKEYDVKTDFEKKLSITYKSYIDSKKT